jgi:hypothetical protein
VVTKSQLDRLTARIDALAPRQDFRFSVIFVHVGETEETAKDRHYAKYPEDRDASHVIVLTFVAAKDGYPVE